jgi:HPt (histidine-containing phosphotransfer) domain-containing protein
MDYELDELKREFLTEAEEKVLEIQSKLDDHSTEALQRLVYLAHQLKGSGGSYGFEQISTDAAELEKTVEQVVEGEPNGGLEQKMKQHALNLRSEVERRSRELSEAVR